MTPLRAPQLKNVAQPHGWPGTSSVSRAANQVGMHPKTRPARVRLLRMDPALGARPRPPRPLPGWGVAIVTTSFQCTGYGSLQPRTSVCSPLVLSVLGPPPAVRRGPPWGTRAQSGLASRRVRKRMSQVDLEKGIQLLTPAHPTTHPGTSRRHIRGAIPSAQSDTSFYVSDCAQFPLPHPPRTNMNTPESPKQVRRTLDARLKQLVPRCTAQAAPPTAGAAAGGPLRSAPGRQLTLSVGPSSCRTALGSPALGGASSAKEGTNGRSRACMGQPPTALSSEQHSTGKDRRPHGAFGVNPSPPRAWRPDPAGEPPDTLAHTRGTPAEDEHPRTAGSSAKGRRWRWKFR